MLTPVAHYLDDLEADSILEIDPGPEPLVRCGRFRRRWVQALAPPELPGVRAVAGRFPDTRPPQLYDVVVWLNCHNWPALLAQGLWRVLAGASTAEQAGALASRDPDAILANPEGGIVAVFHLGPQPRRTRATSLPGGCCG